jgi:hypothetical protein
MDSDSQTRFARAWGRVTGSVRPWRPAALFALLGLLVIAASLLPGQGIDDSWTRDLLLTVGSSLVLFAPLYVITRSLDGHLDAVQAETRQVAAETRQVVEDVRSEAASATAEVQSSIETLRADVDERLENFAERVSAALAAEAAADSAAFNSLRVDEPPRQTVAMAFDRANDLGLLMPGRPPRVKASEGSWLYVSVQFDPDDYAEYLITFCVEEMDGGVLDRIPWEPSETAAEVLVQVGRAIRRRTGDIFEPARLLVGLADLFDAASSDSERRPAIELCGAQWMVCDQRVATSTNDGGAYPYGLQVDQVRPGMDLSYVYGKSWVDADSFDQARAVVLELFPPPSPAWDFGGGKREPPF